MNRTQKYDAIIVGAGAAGLMCALRAGQRGRKVLLLDHSDQVGAKILISGGGRCNFTNSETSADRYISENPHFCISALKSFTQHDFIELIKKHDIAFHEKTLGQLFCDGSAKQIVEMLETECEKAGVTIRTNSKVHKITKGVAFAVHVGKSAYFGDALVVATGGLSIPKMGATNFAHETAQQFNVPVTDMRPALVPLSFQNNMLAFCKGLSGISLEVITSTKKTSFRENMLFTHRGLSGPAILQISSYLKDGEKLHINLLPDLDAEAYLLEQKEKHPKSQIKSILSEQIPTRLAQALSEQHKATGMIGEMNNKIIKAIAQNLNNWEITPSSTEGYDKAEVTVGGISTKALSSKTMETRDVGNLYFIGEAVDVTGWLGGYNLQWAWSSGWAAGSAV